MNFKPGMNILSSSYYTRCKSQPCSLPVWAGWAPASIVFENHRFMPLFGSSLLGTGGLLRVLTDLWSRRSKLLINQVWSPRLSLPWNGGKLKLTKNYVLRKVPPFLKSGHILYPLVFTPSNRRYLFICHTCFITPRACTRGKVIGCIVVVGVSKKIAILEV